MTLDQRASLAALAADLREQARRLRFALMTHDCNPSAREHTADRADELEAWARDVEAALAEVTA